MNESSAGTQLRTAREAQGLSLAALAASLKVTQAKLEALEADRIDLLPDATFARALAQTMCKALKIDPVPVLAALPVGRSHRLEQLGEGINAPFRDDTGRPMARALGGGGGAVWIWAAGLIAVATALVVLVPTAWWSAMRSERSPVAALVEAPEAGSAGRADRVAAGDTPAVASEPDGAASAPSAASTPLPSVGQLAAAPPSIAASAQLASAHAASAASAAASAVARAASSAASSALGSGPLRLTASAESWVEVVDAEGHTLISRTLAEGEQVALDGALPLKLKIGNVLGTEVVFRGVPVDLSKKTKDNVARLEIAR